MEASRDPRPGVLAAAGRPAPGEQQTIARRLYELYVARGYVDTQDLQEIAAQVRAEQRAAARRAA